MKTSVSKCRFMASVVLAACLSQQASAVSREFENACHNGADARVEFHVVDDMGMPIHNARVNVFFDMIDRSKGRRIIGNTDTNGVFVAEAKTGGILEVEVTGDHHYRSKRHMSFIAMGSEHEVSGGKWQPWGAKEDIVLLPIKNPAARRVTSSGWKDTHELNKWIGFDCERYDFVTPFGSGKESDMEVFFDWNGVWDSGYDGMALKLRFPAKFSGGYYANKTPGSEYFGVYSADTNGVYKSEFSFSERVGSRDRRGRVTSWDRHLFDQSKVLVVRSRCKLNEDGTLKSAHYFQLGEIRFSGDERGGALRFLSIFNPTPNDTNLEPK